MPRLFDGVDDLLVLRGPTGHPLVGFDGGPCTVAVVFKPVALPEAHDTIFGLYGSAAGVYAGAVIQGAPSDFHYVTVPGGKGFTSIINTTFGWYLMIASKGEGTSQVRIHRYEYTDSSWFHGDAGVLADSVANPVLNFPRADIGGDGNSNANIHVAAIGVWQRVLSDAECESMPLQVTSWLNLPGGAPVGCWTFSQANVTDPLLDLTGRGFNQTELVGTSISSEISPINEGTYQYVRPSAIPRSPTVGSPSVSTLIQNILPTVISRSPTVGSPEVELGPAPQELSPSAVSSLSSVGSPAVSLGVPPEYMLRVPTTRNPLSSGGASTSGLWRFYAIDSAQTLVKDSGVWRLVRSPREDVLEGFDAYYRGGYEHTVDALTAIELVRDGFGDALTEIPV